jgi:hypothetical protein
MSLENILWLVSVVAEAAVVGLLLYRRFWRRFPTFCAYCAWSLLANAGAFVVLRSFPDSYMGLYLGNLVIDSALEFGVLVELAWSVFRPIRSSLPRYSLAVVVGLIATLGAAVWPFATIPGFAGLPPEWHLLMHIQQTTSILRILVFLLFAACSQLLSISWRDRELQLASGLGFYSFVSVAVAMVHTHREIWSQYSYLNQVEVASAICSLLYWVWCFAQKEAERREFTPQMQNLLLAMARTTRATRVALEDSAVTRKCKPGE